MSLHGRKSDANNAAAKVLTPLQPIANENNQTSGGKRKRMASKKLFDSDYITDESEAVTGKKKIKVKKQIKSKGTETTSTPKRYKTPETKNKELTLL